MPSVEGLVVVGQATYSPSGEKPKPKRMSSELTSLAAPITSVVMVWASGAGSPTRPTSMSISSRFVGGAIVGSAKHMTPLPRSAPLQKMTSRADASASTTPLGRPGRQAYGVPVAS